MFADDEPAVRWLGCSPSILEIDPVCSRVLDSNDDGLRSMRRHAVVIISDPMPHRFIERRTAGHHNVDRDKGLSVQKLF